MTVQEQVSISAPAKPVGAVEVYDFRRPTTLAREHSRVLEVAFDTFARQWGTQLTAKVRVMSQVTCEHVIMHTYDKYAASLPATTAMVLCSLEGIGPKAVIQFSTSAALTWLGYALGGKVGQVPAERKFTEIEEALVYELIDAALEDLRYSLGSLLVVPLTMDLIQYNSQFAQAAATADLMIVATFAIRVGERTTTATVALPAESLMPQLGEATPSSMGASATELLQAQLISVPVEVAVRLNPASVLPGRILHLAVGDVVAIPHAKHRPFDVVVDGRPLARAAVGANGSRLACIVIDNEEKPQ